MSLIECTFSQIRQRKKDYLQQFKSTTVDYTASSDPQFSAYQYKRLFDALNAKNGKKKIRLQKTTKRNAILSGLKINHEIQEQQNLDQPEESHTGFYITQNIQKKKNTQASIASSHFKLQKSKTQQNINPSCLSFSQQDKKIQQIIDKICGQKSIFETLSHQKTQTQNAINHFKKRIIKYQNYLNSQTLKEKEAEKIKMENKEELFKTKCTNSQINKAYIRTLNYFNKDFQGKANIKEQIGKKNQSTFQQAAKRDIIYHKMKETITIQKEQLQQLLKYQGKIYMKKKKVDLLMKRHQQFLQIYQAIFQQQKRIEKSVVVQTLQVSYQDNYPQKNSFLKRLNSLQKKDLLQITSQIIEYFQSLKQQQKKLTQEFKFYIDQKRSKTQRLNELQSKLYQVMISLSSPARISKYKQIQNQSLQKISKIQYRLKILSMCANAFEDRLKFYLSKQFANLHRVIQLWLKNDKSANEFISMFQKKLKDIFSLTKEEVCQKQSKDLLKQFFYNSQNYTFYLQIINQNPFIFRYLNKSSLFNHMKRIVKTKIKNPYLCTAKIFQKSLQQIYQQSLIFFQVKSQQLLKMSKQIYKFLTSAKNIQANLHSFVQNRQSQDPSQFQSRNELVKQQKQSEDYSDYVSFTIQDLKDFNRKSHLQQSKIVRQRLSPNAFYEKMKLGIQLVKIPLNEVKSIHQSIL